MTQLVRHRELSVIPLTTTTGTFMYMEIMAAYCKILRNMYGPGYLSRYSDSLWAGRSGDRIPAGGGGARFSTTVQTVPGAHPASYTMGTGSFPGVQRPGCGVDHPPAV